jgi:hypothetical protein
VLILLMSVATALIQFVVGERKLGRRKAPPLPPSAGGAPLAQPVSAPQIPQPGTP